MFASVHVMKRIYLCHWTLKSVPVGIKLMALVSCFGIVIGCRRWWNYFNGFIAHMSKIDMLGVFG